MKKANELIEVVIATRDRLRCDCKSIVLQIDGRCCCGAESRRADLQDVLDYLRGQASAAEYLVCPGVVADVLEKHLNAMSDAHPGYHIIDVVANPTMINGSKIIQGNGQPQVVMMFFPVMRKI